MKTHKMEALVDGLRGHAKGEAFECPASEVFLLTSLGQASDLGVVEQDEAPPAPAGLANGTGGKRVRNGDTLPTPSEEPTPA